MSLTRTPPRPYLLFADGACSGRTIMVLAHQLARADIADAARRGRVRRYKVALKAALQSAWETARAQRWCHERDAAASTLPASHAAILAERTVALMIDSGRRMVAELAMIDARALALGLRLRAPAAPVSCASSRPGPPRAAIMRSASAAPAYRPRC